ncbi:hypothetical protein D3C87_1503140 [compost metagenome]
MAKKRVNIAIDPELHERATKISAMLDVSFSSFLELVVTQAIEPLRHLESVFDQMEAIKKSAPLVPTEQTNLLISSAVGELMEKAEKGLDLVVSNAQLELEHMKKESESLKEKIKAKKNK